MCVCVFLSILDLSLGHRIKFCIFIFTILLFRLLVELVEKHGVRKWSSIAQMLPGRIGKQCRERWHNHLKPNIKVSFFPLCIIFFLLGHFLFHFYFTFFVIIAFYAVWEWLRGGFSSEHTVPRQVLIIIDQSWN